MAILKKLEEQCTFNFTGRINLLSRENSQHLGLIFLKDGLVVNSYYRDKRGANALFSIILDEVHNNLDFKIIAEPELIPETELALSFTFDEVKREAAQYYNDFKNANNLRPPEELRLTPDPEFILNGGEIDYREFRMLYTLAKYNKVKTIYQNSDFTDHETTLLLVRLRKKKAIRVFK